MHAVDRNLTIARYLGADITHPTFSLPDDEQDRKKIRQWLDDSGVKNGERLIVRRAFISCQY